MLASLGLIGWGLWCLLLAPAHAARYRRWLGAQPGRNWTRGDHPLLSPFEWRVMGSVWLVLGLWGLVAIPV